MSRQGVSPNFFDRSGIHQKGHLGAAAVHFLKSQIRLTDVAKVFFFTDSLAADGEDALDEQPVEEDGVEAGERGRQVRKEALERNCGLERQPAQPLLVFSHPLS